MIRVGIGGWVFEPWRGTFYPPDLPKTRELHYASRHLTTIEINATFYGAQKPASFRRWRDETPDGFVFSVKAPRFATQRQDLATAGGTIERFVSGGILELGDKLGPILWQFPPSARFEEAAMTAFLALLPPMAEGRRLRHAVEVAHRSFATPRFVELLRARGVAVVFVDSDKHPPIYDATADFVYAHLRRATEDEAAGYPPAALDAWAARFRLWATGGEPQDLPRQLAAPASAKRRDCFVYFISGGKVRAPAAAAALIARLAD